MTIKEAVTISPHKPYSFFKKVTTMKNKATTYNKNNDIVVFHPGFTVIKIEYKSYEEVIIVTMNPKRHVNTRKANTTFIEVVHVFGRRGEKR